MSECEEEREDDEPSLSVIVSLVDLLVSGVGVGSAAQFVLFTPVLGMGREGDIYIGVTQYPPAAAPIADRPRHLPPPSASVDIGGGGRPKR